MSDERKSPWGKIIAAIVLLVVAVAAYQMFSGDEEQVSYKTKKLERKTVKAYVAATGTIESTTTVTVGSQVSGPVSEVMVDFNSAVKEGQVLAKIDPSEYLAGQARAQANLQSAQASLSSAQANLAGQEAAVRQAEVAVSTARNNLRQNQANLEVANAGVATAKANLVSAKATRENRRLQYKRQEDLVARELISLSDRDTARTDFLVASSAVQTAQASVQQSQAQVAQARAQVAAGQNEIRAAQARLSSARAQAQASLAQVSASQAGVAQAQAGVLEANVNVERTTITSPIAGVVIDRKIDPGSTVAARFQAPDLFTIARDLSKMQVKAEVSEADIGRVKEGAPVKFTVDAYRGQDFEGEVVQVRSAPDKAKEGAKTNVVIYGVMVTAPNPENLLKPGMTATVEILSEKLEDALVVPAQSLRFIPSKKDDDEEEDKGKKGTPSPSPSPEDEDKKDKLVPGTRKAAVWILKDDTPEKRDIITGIAVEDDVVVVSGDLKVDEEVIISEDDDGKKKRRFRLRF